MPIKNRAFRIDPETAELHYEGPNVFGGYTEGIKDLNHFSQLPTGDVANQDEDGFLLYHWTIKTYG